MPDLTLSIFPGLDMLGMAFEEEGYCVVSGPDVIWGRDIRRFHPPAERFDGIIGGDPCQAHSTLANLVRAKGLEPRFGDMTGEYARVIEEARPRWFLRENVPHAPDISPSGYSVTSFLLCNSWIDSGDGFGEEQMRKRRFWFGWREEYGEAPNLMRYVRQAVFELPKAHAQTGGGVWVGASAEYPKTKRQKKTEVLDGGKVQRSPSTRRHGTDLTAASDRASYKPRQKNVPVVGAPPTTHRPNEGHGNRYTIAEMCELQGLPPDLLDEAPFTMQGKRKLIGNGVPLSMGRQLARAVRIAIEWENTHDPSRNGTRCVYGYWTASTADMKEESDGA